MGKTSKDLTPGLSNPYEVVRARARARAVSMKPLLDEPIDTAVARGEVRKLAYRVSSTTGAKPTTLIPGPTPEEGTMAAETAQRRADPKTTRICDLLEGDKLFLATNMDITGMVVGIDSQILGVQWSDQPAYTVGWGAFRSSTTLLSNWERGAVFNPWAASVVVPADTPIKKISTVDFDSVILAQHKKQQILDAISQVDNHKLIFETWGFSEIFEKGTAISLLFYGPPGTGKTLMAQAIADKFGYKLQIVSTAEIETPEPGGAERNLKKYFAEAQTNKTVLLFDECDSLVSDRKHVGMILAAQINALLSELERFSGIAIFTTNRLETLDPAFDRRLSLKLEFAMPDAAHRVLIWKRMFPKKCPLAKNIRWEDLASIEIAGGHIKNVVLKAARMAAAQKATEITDEILWECLEREVESQEAYTEALGSNEQVWGTPLPNRGAGMTTRSDLKRGRGAISNG